MGSASGSVQATIERVYRDDSRRILATLIRLLGDFDAAEDAMHEAFAIAAKSWESEMPSNPVSWLISTGRFRGIDALRRRSRLDTRLPLIAAEQESRVDTDPTEIEAVPDDQLRLIFTCCHPALAADARPALTLREVCGLTTEEIARAFLAKPATIAQRIVRAKAKIRQARIPYTVPDERDLPDRLEAVLQVVYLVYNEGYAATSGESVTRADLSGEAIRLGRLLVELLPSSEGFGLLALMLLHESRRETRVDANGDVVLLEDQDRSRWDRARINEGLAALARATAAVSAGPYTIQAAIAAEHVVAPNAGATAWGRIVDLYDMLLSVNPSPVVELNRAIAVAMSDTPRAGLELVDALLARGELAEFHLVHAARADLLRRLGKHDEARSAYGRALELATQDPERRFLLRRIGELDSHSGVDSGPRDSTKE